MVLIFAQVMFAWNHIGKRTSIDSLPQPTRNQP